MNGSIGKILFYQTLMLSQSVREKHEREELPPSQHERIKFSGHHSVSWITIFFISATVKTLL
jgi:hypothetical protein